MAEITTVPFGPQHPVLPEPIHLDLELKDERVVRAVPSIGYVHRGLEKLVEKRDFKQFSTVPVIPMRQKKMALSGWKISG